MKMIICNKCHREHYDDLPCDRSLRVRGDWNAMYPSSERGPHRPLRRKVEKAPPKECAICGCLENQGAKLASFFFVDPIFVPGSLKKVDRGPQTVHKTCYRKVMGAKK